MTKKHKCDSMKTVGTKNQHKNENQIPKGYQEGEIENTKERKINNKMSNENNDQMIIPEERDGIVDNEADFEAQKKRNEAQLKKEIKSAQNEDELSIGDYEDREFIPFKTVNVNKELKLAKRERVLGRGVFRVFAKVSS